MTFRDQIRALLEARGWTKAELAQAVGVSTPAVERWVRGVQGVACSGVVRRALTELGIELDDPLPPAWAIEIEEKRRARGWTANHAGGLIGLRTLSYIESGIHRLPDVIAAELLRDLLGLSAVPPYQDKRADGRAFARKMFVRRLSDQASDIEQRDVWGDRVRAARIARRKSKVSLAKQAGVSASLINHLERSEVEPIQPGRYRATIILERILSTSFVRPWSELSRLERLRVARLRRGWTIEQLGDRAGISRAVVRRIESGQRYSEDFFQYVLTALEITEDDLSAPEPPAFVK